MITKKEAESFASEMEDQVKLTNSALDQAIEWIKYNLTPEDVFSTKDLEAWAESNGYKKE